MDLEAAARALGLQGPPTLADLTAAEVLRAFRQECLTAHPDKGGDVSRFQQLTAARDALLATLEAAAAGQRQQQERTERRVLAALRSLARLQEQHPPDRGHALSIAAKRMQTRGAEVDCPVLTISGTSWRKVLVPTGHLLGAPDGQREHWDWPLPEALRALQQRFPSSSGHTLLCNELGVSVVQCAADGQRLASSGLVTAAQIAGNEWQTVVAALELSPAKGPAAPVPSPSEAATAQHVGSGPSTPSSSEADAAGTHQPTVAAAAAAGLSAPALPADVQAAAERAAAIVLEFERVFSSAALLQAIGRQQTAGSEVSRQLFQGAAAAIRSHYTLGSAAAAGSSSLQALLALAGGALGTTCCRQALQRLADELVQSLLPVLARAPQGLPAELTPDVPAAPQPCSIVVHCRRFGCTEGCLARFAPGVSVHGLYVDGIARARACDSRSKDGYRCQPCAAVAPQPEAGKKRPAAGQLEAEEQRPPSRKPQQKQQLPEERCAALLRRFRQAVAAGSNPFAPALLAADGSERCAAGRARSACAEQASLAYFDQLLSSLGHSTTSAASDPEPDGRQAAAVEQEPAAGAAAAAAAAAVGPAGADAADEAALSAADAAEYVKLAERLPQLRGSLRACKRQGPGCCGVGKARKFVCCLQGWNALSGECAACWDALYAPGSR
ncbi:hypothetical protein COHA_004707 [Chlorella ohadii]|uniref:J domain-containing protein n=1 Tax=Chlorella ohadii TaxID=2649997 RepID=A0AAD5H2K5_9CHLO|nr:hypothetical protein COHA_004707 [Chlorella ohadii]